MHRAPRHSICALSVKVLHAATGSPGVRLLHSSVRHTICHRAHDHHAAATCSNEGHADRIELAAPAAPSLATIQQPTDACMVDAALQQSSQASRHLSSTVDLPQPPSKRAANTAGLPSASDTGGAATALLMTPAAQSRQPMARVTPTTCLRPAVPSGSNQQKMMRLLPAAADRLRSPATETCTFSDISSDTAAECLPLQHCLETGGSLTNARRCNKRIGEV